MCKYIVILVPFILSILFVTSCIDPIKTEPLPTPTPFPTCAAKTVTANTIDFCDDGDTINARGGGWSTSASGNASVGYVGIISTGFGNCGYRAQFEGYMLDQNQNTYIIMGTTLSYPKTPNDISGKTGIKFWHKGYQNSSDSPVTMTARVMISSPAIFPIPGDNNNMFGVTFTASDSWALLQVPFSDFTQELGWGDIVSLSGSLQNAETVEWKLVRETFNDKYLQVDEIEFY